MVRLLRRAHECSSSATVELLRAEDSEVAGEGEDDMVTLGATPLLFALGKLPEDTAWDKAEFVEYARARASHPTANRAELS